MVEPITCMIIGCVLSGIGILLTATATFIGIYTTYQLRKMSDSQKRKYNKAKQKIMNKYSFSTTPDEYIKLACSLHLAKSEAKQCSHLNISSDSGNLTLMVSLNDIELKYKPFKTWYNCKCHFDETDKSIWATFLDIKSRDRFQSYIKNNIDVADIMTKCRDLNKISDDDRSDDDTGNDSENDDYELFDETKYKPSKKSTLRKRDVKTQTETPASGWYLDGVTTETERDTSAKDFFW